MPVHNPIESRRQKTLLLVQFSLLLAIEAIVCFTPLGSLPIGPLVATLGHIPCIVTAITLGTGAGTLMGFFMGLFSFLYWTFNPGPLAFVFTPFYSASMAAEGNLWSLVIVFVPRILVGTGAGAVFALLNRFLKKTKFDFLSYVTAGIVGSLANTVLVLGGIYLFFGQPYAEANGIAYEALFGAMMAVVGTNGILELVLAAVCAYAICKPIRKFVMHTDTIRASAYEPLASSSELE